MDQLQKVKVVARIRQQNISETYSNAPQQAQNISNIQANTSQMGTVKNFGDNVSMAQTQMGSPKSILANANQGMAQNSSLDKDGKVCIFTASSKQVKPIYVAASGNPIKKQLLQEYVKTDKNIIQYRHSILENANIFKFDHAMSYKINNEEIYKFQCQDLVQKAMSQGISSTFIVVGPAKAGKKFTIKGGEQTEKGILTRAVDDMIKLSELQSQSSGTKVTQKNKPVTVVFSIYAIYNNEIVDLLQKDPNEDELEEIELTFSGEFRKYYMKSRERLKSIGQGEQSIRRLHIIYKFQIYRNETGKSKNRIMNAPNGGLFSTVTFVHCADFCKAKLPEFVVLGDYLTDIATRKDANVMEVPAYSNSKLVSQLNDSLNSGKDNSCVLICNISGSYDYLSQSVDCLQYCAGIKERIDHYYEDVNTFNQDQDMINQLASPNNKSAQDLQQGSNIYRGSLGNSGVNGQGGEAAGTFRNSQNEFNKKYYENELIHVPMRDATYQFRRLRGENPNAQEIQQDLSNLMKDIYTFTDQTNGLTEEEIKDWAHDREQELQSIQNDISKLPPEQQKQFEAAQFKIAESLNFLQQIKKNAAQLAQNRSPTSGALKMSDDLGTLMSQYNKSKESLLRGSGSQEDLVKSYNQSDLQEGANQSYTYQNNQNGGKKSMQELREQILNKIEEVINENDASRRTVKVGGRNGESAEQYAERSSRNLRQLKEMLADQDFLIQEKRQRLKQKNKELREQQVELRNQLQYLENDIKEKDARVQYVQDQNEQLKEQIERDREIIQLKIDKEELLEKNDEELRELIDRLKIKLQRRKEECLMLKDNIDKVERDIYQQRVFYEEEKNSMVRQIKDLTNAYEDEKVRNQDIQRINENLDYQIDNQERLLKKLQEDLELSNKRYDNIQIMYQEEQSLSKELKLAQAVYEKRIDEAEDRAQTLEVKLNKLKRRFQEERNQIVEEKDQELIKKKEATARLKNEIKDLERRVQELTQDLKILKIENQKLQTFNEEIQRDQMQKNQQIKDLSEELESVQQELKRVRNIQRENAQYSSNDQQEKKKLLDENERLNHHLRKQDASIHMLETELEEKNIYIENLKKDLLQIDKENYGQKGFISQLERQNQYLSDVQHTDIDRLESKVKQLNQEIISLRKENQDLSQRDNEQQLRLTEFKIFTEKQNDKLNKNKNVIKHLTTQLDQMDEKVKELIHEKNLEISHVHQSSISQNAHNQSKNQINDSLFKSAQTYQRNTPAGVQPQQQQYNQQQQQQQRSILKKPRFNLIESDSDDSDYSSI
ncbi:kinesin motor catalytic domain protein (macronuclear) [Tetrahymena thermophila SB210]|uniref:Kinesin motor catalytic domain protein n=1 Tax=Tetrahymena thermophila (strain SB210) TaxID=312017 RepID=I7M6D8_TETTS|nr:kinesin motor catalytic domain protein [Tetrahymena thermophila SB210]EAR85023.1 kinesin motor catalytic domain protein [Tetrahymena thermophila SB210]|eukprot:XP_001032686.1 kinesin motor catalytic domain protein [Tetrahymena thermophila SB210]